MTRFLKISVTILCAAALGSCAPSKVEPAPGEAIFDSFTYTGDDEYPALPDSCSFYNPVIPGWHSDPAICLGDSGNYYMVTSSFSYFPGVPLFHSRDLMNWRHAGYVLSRPSQLPNLENQVVRGGIYAPDIKYNRANGLYYMITTNVGAGNFYVTAADPEGTWSDPVMLPGINGIDPAFFFDEDGKAYIVHNDVAPDDKPEYEGHRTIRMTEFDVASGKCVGPERIIVDKGTDPARKPIWCEGPHIYKINGMYYLMTAEDGTGFDHSEVIYRSGDVWGPYTPWEGNPMLTQRTLPDRPNPVTCTGHADMVQTPEGDWWAVFLGCRPIDGKFENLGRETFMLPVKWTADGWPYMLREGETVDTIISRPGVKRLPESLSGNFSITDEFTDTVRSLQWFTLRGPADEYISLSAHPGYLTVKCADVDTRELRPLPYLGRPLQHHRFTASTAMDFNPADSTQSAGLLVMKDENHQFRFAKTATANGPIVYVDKVSPTGIERLGQTPAPDGTLILTISSDGPTFTFTMSAAPKGATTSESVVVAGSIDASHTSTATADGFTGTTLGPFASGKL